MVERRKTRKRKEEASSNEKPSKEEYSVAKHLRFNCPTKQTMMYGQKVEFFVASKAVDCLMDSKWATGKDAMFTTRDSIVNYMNNLMMWEVFFHRAQKHVKTVPLKEKKAVKERKDEDTQDEKKAKRKTEKTEATTDKDTKSSKTDKKEKRKIKLEMHQHQVFVDGNDVYVWMYDPVSTKTFIMGTLLVVGSIAICMFPLWPTEVRTGVYYTSLAALAFVGSIFALVIVRLIVFCVVWCLTFGRHHLWIFPNLTEDVGFFESFVPLYEHHGTGSEKETVDEKCDEDTEEKSKGEKDDGEREGGEGEEGEEGEDGTECDNLGDDDPEGGSDVQNSGRSASDSGGGSDDDDSDKRHREGEEFEVIQQGEIDDVSGGMSADDDDTKR